MIKLVRGGIILVVLSLFVVIIYAQTRPGENLSIAKDSQPRTIENTINTENNNQVQDQTKEKDLVKNTGYVKAAKRSAGASKGSFVATAYCLKGRTAMGHGVRRGIIAADPRVLRLGSSVLLGGGAYSGQYLVSDTGGRIKGKKIDIWVPSCAEARRFGRRTVLISMVEK
jgi:3D (Asp-Asp-Asp) domain-containing protein